MSDRREQTIRDRAYAIWEQEGRPDNKAKAHWLRAEAEYLCTHIHSMTRVEDTEAPPLSYTHSHNAFHRKLARDMWSDKYRTAMASLMRFVSLYRKDVTKIWHKFLKVRPGTMTAYATLAAAIAAFLSAVAAFLAVRAAEQQEKATFTSQLYSKQVDVIANMVTKTMALNHLY